MTAGSERVYGQFIDGEWSNAGTQETTTVTNPCDLSEVVGHVSVALPEDVDRAVRSAHTAFLRWRDVPAIERGEILHSVANSLREKADEIGEMFRRESGRIIREAPREVLGMAGLFDYFAEEALRLRGAIPQANERDRLVMVFEEPVGVVAAISPWNNPLYLLGRVIAPAIAVGCAVVAKPPSETPISTLLAAEAIYGAGLPAGVLNVITGPGGKTGEALVTHPLVRKVGFTGGLEGGRRVMALAARGVKGVTLELGGQCPAIVCSDGDVEAAAESIVFQAFRQGGHVCNRVNRVLAHKDVYEELRSRLALLIERLVVSDSSDTRADLAALANEAQVALCEDHVEDAVKKGARIEAGGYRLTEGKFAKGTYYSTTLLSGCTPDMRVMQEETFGPVLALSSFEDLEDAKRAANDSIYGLSAFIFTREMNSALKAVRDLEAGTVWVNDIHLTYTQCPYGGYKQSGIGRSQGPEALREYLETKTTYWNTADYQREHKIGH